MIRTELLLALLCAGAAPESNPVVLVRPELPPEPPMPRSEQVSWQAPALPVADPPWRGVTVVLGDDAGLSEADVRGYLRAEAAKRKTRKAQKAARKRQRSNR
jgi:hypothetical protein